MHFLGEAALKTLEDTNGRFVELLLETSKASTDVNVKLSASIYLKNYIKNHWNAASSKIKDSDRTIIKSQLVDLLLNSGKKSTQNVFMEAISLISRDDFAFLWSVLNERIFPTLKSGLEAFLASDAPLLQEIELGVVCASLIHALFRKYKLEEKSDDLFRELKFLLDNFVPHFHAALLICEKALDKSLALIKMENSAMNSGLARISISLMEILSFLCKIFYCLNYQDLPEYFEDNITSFMNVFSKNLFRQDFSSLRSTFPTLFEIEDAFETGPIERLQLAILENICLYAFKYEEDFVGLDSFIDCVWRFLVTVPKDQIYDGVVCECLNFLTIVAKSHARKSLFASEQFLFDFCDQIICQNILLRECDYELFVDEPIEWVKRVIEGTSAIKSRRECSLTLIRALLIFHEAILAPIVLRFVDKYLQLARSGGASSIFYLDAAILLYSSIAASGAIVTERGPTQLNPLAKARLDAFYTDVILGQLSQIESKRSDILILVVDSMQFICSFRNHLTKVQLQVAFPYAVSCLNSTEEATCTMGAITIDRMLSVKDAASNRLLFSSVDIAPFTQAIIGTIMKIFASKSTPEKLAANEYLIKTFLRLIVVAKSEFSAFFTQLFEPLMEIVRQISNNPSNPRFTHFLFESISYLIRFNCLFASPETSAQGWNNYLFAAQRCFEVFQIILQAEVVELTPYVFQTFTLLLSVVPNEKSILPPFMQLFALVLQPAAWSNTQNVPALVKLLQMFVSKSPSHVATQINTIMGVIQILLKSKTNELNAISLTNLLFKHLPFAVTSSYLQPFLSLLLDRLQQTNKSARMSYGTVLFVCNFCAFCGGNSSIPDGTFKPVEAVGILVDTFAKMQPDLLVMLLNSVLLPEAEKSHDHNEKLLIMLGLTRLLPFLLQDAAISIVAAPTPAIRSLVVACVGIVRVVALLSAQQLLQKQNWARIAAAQETAPENDATNECFNETSTKLSALPTPSALQELKGEAPRVVEEIVATLRAFAGPLVAILRVIDANPDVVTTASAHYKELGVGGVAIIAPAVDLLKSLQISLS